MIDRWYIFADSDYARHSSGSRWCGQDPADSFRGSRLHTDFDIPGVSPSSSHRILYQEIFDSVFDAVAHSQYTMVSFDAAFFRSDNATFVHLEHRLVALNCHGNGLFGDGCLQIGGIVWSHIDVLFDANETVSLEIPTG